MVTRFSLEIAQKNTEFEKINTIYESFFCIFVRILLIFLECSLTNTHESQTSHKLIDHCCISLRDFQTHQI